MDTSVELKDIDTKLNGVDIKIVRPDNITFDIVENILVILIDLTMWLFTFYILNLIMIKLLETRQFNLQE